MNPIHIKELLDRVSGNREFVVQMLELFFQTSDERFSVLRKEFQARNYAELADQAHKLKGLVGNLSINQASALLKEIHSASRRMDDSKIEILLTELDQSLADAKAFYLKNPSLKIY
jgi:HPt (histidine-containing phosphotransfer) domain-containing protein